MESIFSDIAVMIVAFTLDEVSLSVISIMLNYSLIILSMYYSLGFITSIIVANLVG